MRSLGINVSLKVSLCIELSLVIKQSLCGSVKINFCLSVCFFFSLLSDSLTHMTYLWLSNKWSQIMCKRGSFFVQKGKMCSLLSHLQSFSCISVITSSRKWCLMW